LDEAVTYTVWLIPLLVELQLRFKTPVQIFQDNLSTITIAKNGGNFSRSKHIMNKQAFVKQYIEDGTLELVYCSSGTMPADMISKPVSGSITRKLCDLISLVDMT
jgi:hypothetical protein